jgi:hypothetical protein
MIIHTTNESLAALLAPYGLRMPDDDHVFCMAQATVQQLDRLCTVMTTKYAGQWTVNFDGHPTASYEDLTGGLDGANWQTFMLAPGKYGGDTEDLINFVENIYGLPVDNANHEQVVQMFRLWYAATSPDKYVNPPNQRRDVVKKAQSARRDRLTQAANRLNYATIDKLAVAVLALGDEDAAALRAHFEEVTQKT